MFKGDGQLLIDYEGDLMKPVALPGLHCLLHSTVLLNIDNWL